MRPEKPFLNGIRSEYNPVHMVEYGPESTVPYLAIYIPTSTIPVFRDTNIKTNSIVSTGPMDKYRVHAGKLFGGEQALVGLNFIEIPMPVFLPKCIWRRSIKACE